MYTNEILYGIINAIVGAPTMISFAAIVYQVPLRETYPELSCWPAAVAHFVRPATMPAPVLLPCATDSQKTGCPWRCTGSLIQRRPAVAG